MSPAENPEITQLLKAWAAGDEAAHQRLIPLIYGDLRAVAGRVRYRSGAARGSIEDTLQTSGLPCGFERFEILSQNSRDLQVWNGGLAGLHQ